MELMKMARSEKKPRSHKLDSEERALEAALARGEFEETMPRKAAQADWNKVVANTRKKVPITVRVSGDVIDKLKAEAMREGMPYQTLLSSVLHKYVAGRLKETN
jgi:predicted DNA binding CopG/RHH family protein